MLAGGFVFISLLASIQVVSASVTPLTQSEVSSYKPFTSFASTAYCNPSTTLTWSCNTECAANPDFKPVASGETVIVAHQGTDTTKIEAVITDANAILGPLDSNLFPGISSSIRAHSGFANAQAQTATQILSAVQSAIAQNGATSVTTVGHSLGAAIALLDAVYLPLHISGVSFRMIGYGMPRVGNQAFADYIDANLGITHINNKKDFVPITPVPLLGYHHSSGEVHIMDNDQWVSCFGQDNTDSECIVGAVPTVAQGNARDHSGPYDGVTMGVGC